MFENQLPCVRFVQSCVEICPAKADRDVMVADALKHVLLGALDCLARCQSCAGVLRQMNLHLMGRGHAKSARDAVSMYSSLPGNLTPNKTKVVRVALTGGPCAGKPSAHS